MILVMDGFDVCENLYLCVYSMCVHMISELFTVD